MRIEHEIRPAAGAELPAGHAARVSVNRSARAPSAKSVQF